MKYLVIVSLVLAFFLSCEKIDYSKTPDIPNNDSIDVNNDSQYDFVIDYWSTATMDIPPTAQSITGALRPLNNNQVLKGTSAGYLFLHINDTIRKESNTDSEWHDYAATLIGINGSHDKWDKEWTINSDLNIGYFLGIRLKGDIEKIGWILLNLNKKSGEISVKDVRLTESNELIIKNK